MRKSIIASVGGSIGLTIVLLSAGWSDAPPMPRANPMFGGPMTPNQKLLSPPPFGFEGEMDENQFPHGEWYHKSKEGKVLERISFRHGQLLLCESWWPNGVKRYQQFFADGMPHGLWVWWNDQGEELARSWYEHGTGTTYNFDSDGALRSKTVWVANELVKSETMKAK